MKGDKKVPGRDPRHRLHAIHICLPVPEYLFWDLKSQFYLFHMSKIIIQHEIKKLNKLDKKIAVIR